MIGHKKCLNKFKKIEIISSLFTELKGLKLEIKLKENSQKIKLLEIEKHAIKQ